MPVDPGNRAADPRRHGGGLLPRGRQPCAAGARSRSAETAACGLVAPPAPRSAQLQRREDRPRRRRAVERVEVDPRSAPREQLRALERRVGDAEFEHRLGVVGPEFERFQQRRRDRRAAHRGHRLDLRDVRDRHDPRDDRDFDSGETGRVDEPHVVLVVEEQLRDQEPRAAVDLRLQELQVAERVAGLRVEPRGSRRRRRRRLDARLRSAPRARSSDSAHRDGAAIRSHRAAGRRGARARSRCRPRRARRASRTTRRGWRRRT